MKKTIPLVLLLIVSVYLSAVINVNADTVKYTYESDTIRWYYEKTTYEYPRYYSNPYYYYSYPYPYPYNHSQYSPYYFPYYFPYYSPSYSTAYSYRNVKVYEYYLSVKTDLSGATVSGEGWYKEGSGAAISASKTIELGDTTRYDFLLWTGDYSGGSPSATVTMDTPKTVTANYEASHTLLVRSIPSDVLGLIDDNWYTEGTTKRLQEAPEIVKAGQYKRYVFESWYVDGQRVSGNPITVELDEPHLVESKYTVQYYLSVTSIYGYPQGDGWYDDDETATFDVTTPINAGYGRKWVFEQWSGDTVTASPQGTIRMDDSKSVTALWRLDSTVLYMTYGIILAIVAVIVGVVAILIVRHPHSQAQLSQATQHCRNCGSSIDKNFKFCPNCASKNK